MAVPDTQSKALHIVIVELVIIDRDAFSGCAYLETIRIPKSVEKFNYNAFDVWSSAVRKDEEPKYVQALDGAANIFVDEQNAAYADVDGVLFNKEKTVLLIYPKARKQAEYIVPEDVTEIAPRAFEHCKNLRSVNFPESLKKIGFGAFGNCASLESINMPKNIPTLDRSRLEDTAWFASKPDGLIYIGDVAYKYKGKMPENFTIHIKDGTKRIAKEAFESQSNLVEVTFPNSLVEIERYAFNCCHNLAEVALPHGDIKIAEDAFYCTAYGRNKKKEAGK